MNRREFSLQLAGAAGAAALSTLLPGLALASPAAPVDGTDYLRLQTPLNLPKTGKVEVMEFFWYGCPHCNHFEPTIEPWIARLPADVHFRRVPVQFNALQGIHQRIWYTWEMMGLVEQMHAKTFARFHVQRKPINSESDMLEFAQENGLDVAKVKATWNGFGMGTRVAQAQQLCDDYRVDGVPMIGIHGRYTTSPSQGGEKECLATTDTLVAQLRKTA
ncbi:MAG TPA: thiol:disulfide interchange protein DsbA/DsbL [Burkholderiaceae bacterium]|jgi:thiol:disulfide interchange protein DsbA|nr:thiol:disulfide interchange protein DsbA/DsbL [Burkholderiaceae bacterium]